MNPSKKPIYSAALIGLGAIASGNGCPCEAAPYCHAGGILKSPRFDLAAAADPFSSAREAFSEKWGAALPRVQMYDCMEAMLSARSYDCVAVCVRGPHHQEVMRQVFVAKPRLIFLEKPPTSSLRDADELLELAHYHKIPVVVSYSRHWAPHVLQMEQLVKEGLIGEIQSVVGYCGQLVLSFASHTTELITQFATATTKGKPISISATGGNSLSPRSLVPFDYSARGAESEPNLTALHVQFSNGVLATQIGAAGHSNLFYAEVFGTKGRIQIGFYDVRAAYDLDNQPIELPPLPPNHGPFCEAYNQIATYLDGGPLPDCSNEAFVMVNEIGFGAIESIRREGASVRLPNIKRDRFIYANG